MSDRDPRYDDLARLLTRRGTPTPAKLIGGSTSGGGNTEQPPPFPNPMDAIGEMVRGGTGGAPVAIDAPGSAGLVMVSTAITGGFAGAWSAASGVGQYRQYVLVSDGSGGFDFVDDGFGNPVYTLEALE